MCYIGDDCLQKPQRPSSTLAPTYRPPLHNTARPGGGSSSLPSSNAVRLMNNIANTLQQMTNIEGERLKVERERLDIEKARLDLAIKHCNLKMELYSEVDGEA